MKNFFQEKKIDDEPALFYINRGSINLMIQWVHDGQQQETKKGWVLQEINVIYILFSIK